MGAGRAETAPGPSPHPGPSPDLAPGAPHLAGVDLLRAIACLWVVLFHIGLWWQGAYGLGFASLAASAPDLPTRALVWASRLGLEGVGLFLVLSGFCLYYPLVRRAGVATVTIELWPYAKRRARRILPPYYASIALLTALSVVPATAAVVMRPVTGLDLVAHLGLVHNLIPPTLWTMNGAYWSLGLEAQLYLVFPLLVAAARRLGVFALTALGIVTSALWLLALHGAKLRGLAGDDYGVIYEALPGRLGEFTAGMAAAAVVAEARPVPRWALAVVGLLWAPACHAVQATDWFDYPFERLVNAVSFASLLVLCCRLPARVYRPAPIVLLVRIGAISYSVYLVHQPLLLLLRPYAWQIAPGSWQLSGLGLVASVVAGALFYAAFERPFSAPRAKAKAGAAEGVRKPLREGG